MMAIPAAIDTGAGETLSSPSLLIVARVFFLLMTALGVWLTYVGWVAPSPVDTPSPVDNRSAPTR
jgi:hypothetical protein